MTREYLEICGIDETQLLYWGGRNSAYQITELGQYVREMMGMHTGQSGEAASFEREPYFYILTNQERFRGAAGMLFSDCIQKWAEEKGCNCYILPSSVDEVLVVQEKKIENEAQTLKTLVQSVNQMVGSLQGGRRVWLLAHMPHEYIISGERISPYLLFSNAHDGSCSVKVALTPVRVVCQNTLNLALATAKRSWSMNHVGNIQGKLEEAHNTLFLAEQYTDALGKEFENLRRKELSDRQVQEYIEIRIPIEEGAPPPEPPYAERHVRWCERAEKIRPIRSDGTNPGLWCIAEMQKRIRYDFLYPWLHL